MEAENTIENINSFLELIKWMELQTGVKNPLVRLDAVDYGIIARITWVSIGGKQHGKQCSVAYTMPRNCDFLEPQSMEGHAARHLAQKLVQSWTD